MANPRTPSAAADNLMSMALALLDRDGHDEAACHLQHALDTLRGEQPMREGDELTTGQKALFDRLAQRRAA